MKYVHNITTASKAAGVKYHVLRRRYKGLTATCKRGAPMKSTEEHYRAVATRIREDEEHTTCKLEGSAYVDFADLADKDGRGYKDGRIPPSTKRRIANRMEQMTSRDKALPGANPKHGTIGKGKAISTSAHRQKATTPGPLILFYKSIEAALEAYPYLRDHPEAWINIDER